VGCSKRPGGLNPKYLSVTLNAQRVGQQRIDLDIGISAADLSVLRRSVAELRLHPAGPAASTTAAAASTSTRSSLSSLPDEDITNSSAQASPAKARSTTVQFQSEAMLTNGGGASSGTTPESTRRAARPVSAVRRKKPEAGGGGEADLACDLHAVLQATAAENQRALQQAALSSSADSSTPTADAAITHRQSALNDEAAGAAVPPAVATAASPLASEQVNVAREAHCEAATARPGPSAAAAGDGAGT
jgi:hypothetical protein